jgi:hypothetical protein
MKKITFLLSGIIAVGLLAFAGCDGETETTTTAATTAASTTGMPGSTSTGTGGTGGGGGAGGGTADACQGYCDTIMDNCKDVNVQYMDAATCLGTCKMLPPGAAGDQMGNTVQCRTYHAGAPATMNAAMHCTHAGPGGDDFCGNNCESFCSIATKTCATQWPDMTTCLTTCGGFDKMPKYSSSVIAGNSFACRLYHLTVATVDPASHCGHTIEMTKMGDPCF